MVRYYRTLQERHREVSLYDKVIRRVKGRRITRPRPVQPSRHAEVPFYQYEKTWSICPEMIAGICERYDVSADCVEDFFAWFDKLDFTLDMQHPLPWRFAEVDCYFDGESEFHMPSFSFF
jgi:hypothetical protein